MKNEIETRKKVRKHIRNTILNSGIKTKGYRCEYQCKPLNENWDGHYYTFEELVHELIRLGKAEWDIWLTTYDSDSRDEPSGDLCMYYQYFDLENVK
tara:strand:- start:25 stop:315 length:291 start_codon:yes stop_codon:yes gene_type:complete